MLNSEHARITRRQVLARAGRLSLGAAALPATAWLSACSQSLAKITGSATPVHTGTPGPTETPAATPDTRAITVVITGDVMLGRSVDATIRASSDGYPFNYTADYLRAADITAGNLECVVSTMGQPVPNKPYHFRCDPKAFGRLNAAGFDIVSLANNHSGDFGQNAYSDMLAQLPAHGLTPLGGGKNLADAHQPAIVTVRSTSVGFLAYCEIGPFSFAATRTSPGHAWLDPALMRDDIASLRPHVDYLIVFMHWGIEYSQAETGHQQAVAHQAVEAGADFVVGSHPHVIQPSQALSGKPVVYSLGNFVFDQMWSDDVRRGNVLSLTIAGSQLVDWKLRQCYITGDLGQPQWV